MNDIKSKSILPKAPYLIGVDGDDTLWYTEIVYEKILQHVKNCCRESFNWSDEAFNLLLMSNISITGYGMKTFCYTLIEYIQSNTLNSSSIVNLIIKLYKDTWHNDMKLYEHALSFIDIIGKKFNLVLITQGDSYEQMSKIKRSGLKFDDIEIVSQKSEKCYTDLIAKRGVSPSNFIMVGNSFKSDVVPVLNIGSKAIYVKSKWQFELIDDMLNHPHLYRSDTLLNAIETINKITI